MCQLREHLARIFFPAHCACMNFFWHDGLVQEFFFYAYALAGYFFSKSPNPPSEVNGRPLKNPEAKTYPLRTCNSGLGILISIFLHHCSSFLGFSMYCFIASNSFSSSLSGIFSGLAKYTIPSFLGPYDISQIVRVFFMMRVGRTRSFSKRFIKLLFPALVSPVRRTKYIVNIMLLLI